MQFEKKQVVKEDGRYLVYYHFPATATEEQTAAFRDVAGHGPSPVPADALHAHTDESNADKASGKVERVV